MNDLSVVVLCVSVTDVHVCVLMSKFDHVQDIFI